MRKVLIVLKETLNIPQDINQILLTRRLRMFWICFIIKDLDATRYKCVRCASQTYSQTIITSLFLIQFRILLSILDT